MEACWESTNVLHSRCLRGEEGPREDREAEKENCDSCGIHPRVRVRPPCPLPPAIRFFLKSSGVQPVQRGV